MTYCCDPEHKHNFIEIRKNDEDYSQESIELLRHQTEAHKLSKELLQNSIDRELSEITKFNNLQMVKWFFQNGATSSTKRVQTLFIKSTRYGHPNVAMWIYDTYKTQIDENIDDIRYALNTLGETGKILLKHINIKN